MFPLCKPRTSAARQSWSFEQLGTSTDGRANSVRVQQGFRLTPRHFAANIFHYSLGDPAGARTVRHRHERGNGAGCLSAATLAIAEHESRDETPPVCTRRSDGSIGCARQEVSSELYPGRAEVEERPCGVRPASTGRSCKKTNSSAEYLRTALPSVVVRKLVPVTPSYPGVMSTTFEPIEITADWSMAAVGCRLPKMASRLRRLGGHWGDPGQGVAPSGAAGDTPAAAGERRVPTTFSVVVPKFYPHDPPLVYADRCFSRTCSFVRKDGMLQVPFLTTGVWSSVSTMTFVARTLLQGLRDFVAGKPQPWESPVGSSPNQNCHLRGEQGMPDPVALVACSTAEDINESARTTPRFASSGSKTGSGEADARPGYAMWMAKKEASLGEGTRAPPRISGGFSSAAGQQEAECGGTAMDVVDSR